MQKGKHKAKKAAIQGMIDWIVNYMLENGYPPNKQEIEMGIKISQTTLRAWLLEARAQRLLDFNQTARSFTVAGVYYIDDRGG